MELQGTVYKKLDREQISDTFTKQGVVIETHGDYPQIVLVEFANKSLQAVDKVKVGDDVTVSINIRGREWTSPESGETKYFNTISGWRIDALGADTNAQSVGEVVNNAETEMSEAFDDTEDDLPF
jgi:translation initiation factor IF-3